MRVRKFNGTIPFERLLTGDTFRFATANTLDVCMKLEKPTDGIGWNTVDLNTGKLYRTDPGSGVEIVHGAFIEGETEEGE